MTLSQLIAKLIDHEIENGHLDVMVRDGTGKLLPAKSVEIFITGEGEDAIGIDA